MLLVVVSTEFAIKAGAALSQRGSGLLTNHCVSLSRNAFADSAFVFKSPELF